ncbi:phage portal protein%2C SPP1 family [uncultured Eubacterium sp.]|nr:phage portal protein%2C SPP1 family [uncultured Eubacterium sp.]
MGNQIDESKSLSETRLMNGRRIIKTSVTEITENNVIEVLNKALAVHDLNRSDIDYLWKYYKGEQPIRHRVKDVRPEICNKIVENRANEIVSFKVGYLCGEPIQYVSRNGGDEVVKAINTLNEYMFAEDKAAQDQELVEWQMICGTAFRLVLPDEVGEEDEAPFELYTLDPRDTFVVYSNEIGNKPIMAVKYSKDDDEIFHYSIYTENRYFHVDGDILNREKSRPHALNMIPIFEYPANNARLGAFEIVLPLLDTINKVDSNRMDGVEQLVQAFIKFINCDISKEEYEEFLQLGAIKVKSVDGQTADVGVVTSELNQSQSQTLKEDIYNAVLTICGMPNRNGGTSTSDTGSAVLLRDGWSDAEARAKDSENVFKRSEKKMIKLVLRICRDLGGVNLYLKDIDMKFTRRNYEAIQSKSQVLISMLQEPKIHPQLAFQHSGMFSDSESAYTMSMKYYEEQQEKAKALVQKVNPDEENPPKDEDDI